MNIKNTAGFIEDLRSYMLENHSDAHHVVHNLLTLDRKFLLHSDLQDSLS